MEDRELVDSWSGRWLLVKGLPVKPGLSDMLSALLTTSLDPKATATQHEIVAQRLQDHGWTQVPGVPAGWTRAYPVETQLSTVLANTAHQLRNALQAARIYEWDARVEFGEHTVSSLRKYW